MAGSLKAQAPKPAGKPTAPPGSAGTSGPGGQQPRAESVQPPQGDGATPQAHANGGDGPPPAANVVGPNVQGNREEYQLLRKLQSALFGGVYEALGLSSGRGFAIKVLHKSELSRAQETSSIEFCEVPLSEIRFAELMRGDDHIMEAEEHFEDSYCFYVVFELARGGDLLEALKQHPHGFDEMQARRLIQQATKGLACLHSRRVAMQDVSLENMLLHINEKTGNFQVKICDPGQAVVFDTDLKGQELPVDFHGLVGKSFRPPELHAQQKYAATKVDSWCLGWSTFYLLTAQPLFLSVDPAQQDADWLLFRKGDYTTLFQQKGKLCSHTGLDFIFRLMHLEPSRRLSMTEALSHAWLAEPSIPQVPAPKELMPPALVAKLAQQSTSGPESTTTSHTREPATAASASVRVPCNGSTPNHHSASVAASVAASAHPSAAATPHSQVLGRPPAGPPPTAGGGGPPLLPSSSAVPGAQRRWAASPTGVQHTPLMQVRSPGRSPRGSRGMNNTASHMRIPPDRQQPQPQHPQHPQQQHASVAAPSRCLYTVGSPSQSPPPRAVALPGRAVAPTALRSPPPPAAPWRLGGGCCGHDSTRGLPHRSSPQPVHQHRAPPGTPAHCEEGRPCPLEPSRGPSAAAPPTHSRPARTPASGSTAAPAAAPTLVANSIVVPPQGPGQATAGARSLSPGQILSPVVNFSWANAPGVFSPRSGLVSAVPGHRGTPMALRAASPTPLPPGGHHMAVTMRGGFAWSPEPASPHSLSRSCSPVAAPAQLAQVQAQALQGPPLAMAALPGGCMTPAAVRR